MLRVENLVCGYNSKFVLKDVSFSVKRSELMGIIGPNGSGKTTLIRAISRVLKPIKGKITIDGKDIWKMPLKELARRMAVVSQESQMGFMKLVDYVLLGRKPHYRNLQFFETDRDLEIARRAISLTGISHLEERSLREMSGGERQLASIARALAQEPEILLLDEPVSHLDIAHQLSVLSLIRKLNKEFGLTVIVVLHELNLASEFCDRLILMEEGRVHRIGKPEEVIRKDILRKVYGTDVFIGENPISSRPYILVSAVDGGN